MRSLQYFGLLLGALVVASCGANQIRASDKQNDDEERNLIVGGTRVRGDEFNFFARMEKGNSLCGGALISSRHVITSAKCLFDTFGSDGKPPSVRLGTINDLTLSNVFMVECVQVHPLYNDVFPSSSAPIYDIAILTLSGESSINPLPLNTFLEYPATRSELTLLGFGATSPWVRTPSPSLQEATLPFVDFTVCNLFFSNRLNAELHFCAGGANGTGGCVSDGGGPLVGIHPSHTNSKYILAGIYSFNTFSCGDQTPDVFSAVAPVSVWIRGAIAQVCPPTQAPSSSPTKSAAPSTSQSPTRFPTRKPTPHPTPFPTDSPTEPPTACFSEKATVDVLGQGEVAMKDLQVGQQVFAGYQKSNGNVSTPIYETVYGFGHRDVKEYAGYLRITVDGSEKQPLEISGSHLIFIHGKEEPVRADSLQIGDQLVHASIHQTTATPATIKKIEHVMQRGFYQPLTKDGSILVDGVEASTYVSVYELAPRMVELGLKVFSEQTGFHWYMAPHRFVCTKVAPQLCSNEYSIDEEGLTHWLALGKRIMAAGEDLPAGLMAIYVALIMSFCGLFLFFERLLEGDKWAILTVFSGLGMYWWSTQRWVSRKAKVD